MFKPRLSLTPSRLASLSVWLLVLALCTGLIADLILRFITPPPPPAALHVGVVDPRAAAQHLAARAPLPSTVTATSAAPGAAPEAGPTGFILHGVATGFGRAPGFALIAPTGGTVAAYVTGDRLAPGVTLVGLAPRHVVIERNGARETLPLSREQPAVAVLPLPAPAPVQAPPQPQQALPPAAMPGAIAPRPPRTTGVLSARPLTSHAP